MKIVLEILFAGLLTGCELPGAATPDYIATSIAATVAARAEIATPSGTPAAADSSSAPPPTITLTPTQTATPQNPIVLRDALCFLGPGDPYEVVSSIKAGTPLELVGRGSLAGWWIVRNLLYPNPCWIAAQYIQIDPNTNIACLQIFDPPPTAVATLILPATP